MSTVAELYRDIGEEIGDPGNSRVPTWKLLTQINKAIKDVVKRTKCLWGKKTLQGAMRIAVLDYSDLIGSSKIVTVTVDSISADLTEGAAADWEATGSNGQTATNLATALDAVPGVSAYADWDNGYVYVSGFDATISTITSDADATDLTISDDGYEIFELGNIFTNFRSIRNIYNTERIFRPVTRQQYDRYLLDGNFNGYIYTVSPTNDMYIKAGGANLTSASEITVEYLKWNTALTTVSESPPGIMGNFDEIIINRCVRRNLQFKRFENPRESAQTIMIMDEEYEGMIRQINRELRSHGEPLVQRNLYEWR